jgi:hypothetical protein
MVPAFGVMGALLLGIRIHVRMRTVLIAGIATFAVLVVMAAIDLSRPSNEQTHVGRLISSVGENGPQKLVSVIGRKLDQNLVTLANSDWRPNLVIGLVFLGYVAWSNRRWLARIVTWTPGVPGDADRLRAAGVPGLRAQRLGSRDPGGHVHRADLDARVPRHVTGDPRPPRRARAAAARRLRGTGSDLGGSRGARVR